MSEVILEDKRNNSTFFSCKYFIAGVVYEKPRVFLTGLGVTVGLGSILTVAFSQVSAEAMPTLTRKIHNLRPRVCARQKLHNNRVLVG